jgi:transposase
MANPRKKKVVLLPEAHAPGTPARSETQSVGEMEDDMRSVALDLGSRIAFCEVSDGTVVARGTVNEFQALARWLGPNTPKARVAIESCREAWWAERKLREWGHEPLVIDTTRSRKLGIGQHGRKTDRIDAETLARAVEARLVPRAHVLSEHRQQLRFQLGVRRALVETRAQYTTTVRGLARAHGVRLPTGSPFGFATAVRNAHLGEPLRELANPLLEIIERLDVLVGQADAKLDALAAREPVTTLLKTAPGVATVVAAAFVSVVDDAKRFRKAHELESYLGLVPSEDTSGKRRLGAITKRGNTYTRALLIQAAWAVLKLKGNDPLAQWGRAIALKRGKRVAVVAVARRLVGVLWAMWRDDAVYEAARLGSAMADGAEREAQSAALRAAAMRRAGRKTFRSSSARHRAMP